MKLVVIYGGNSSEREVSIKTAKAIMSAVNDKFEVIGLDFDGNIEKLDCLFSGLDLIFNALHGGSGENGKIQKYFEDKKLPFTGSESIASSIAMNKHQTKLKCLELGLPTPVWKLINSETGFSVGDYYLKDNVKKVVLKPNNEGSSTDLYILENLLNPCSNDYHITFLEKYRSCMIEEYIDGRELTVGILGDQVLPIVEILPKNDFYDYECKYSEGMSQYQVPANLSDELTSQIQHYAYKLHTDLGCRHYSRVDFRLNENNDVYLLEINTLPGMTATSLLPKAAQAYDINFKNLIKNIIDQALKDYLLI